MEDFFDKIFLKIYSRICGEKNLGNRPWDTQSVGQLRNGDMLGEVWEVKKFTVEVWGKQVVRQVDKGWRWKVYSRSRGFYIRQLQYTDSL